MPIYMKYGSIQGSVTEAGHKGWIELNSFQWGVGRSISSPTGNTADREASSPSVSEITVTKLNDVSSVYLVQESLGGEAVEVDIEFTQTSTTGGTQRVYLKYKLTNTLISGYSTSAGGAERPAETLSLNFTEVFEESTPVGSDQKTGTPPKVTYDLAQAKLV
jgi:type VI secretion system secreted protein Hcp